MKEQKRIGAAMCAIAAVMLAMRCGTAGFLFLGWGIFCLLTKKVWIN